MIIDKLEKLEKYATINPLFPKVVEFLKANDLSKMEDGKYEIEGKDLFVNITTTKGKTPDEAVIACCLSFPIMRRRILPRFLTLLQTAM